MTEEQIVILKGENESDTPDEADLGNDPRSNSLVNASDVLPAEIVVLPQPQKPFFPGQVLPLMITGPEWDSTIEAIKKSSSGTVGIIWTRNEDLGETTVDDFAAMGTACRVIRAEVADGHMQLVLAGEKRFAVKQWLSDKAPWRASVEYFEEPEVDADSLEFKAWVTAIINTIKELLPLNPLYGAELKMFLENFRVQDPSRLADFSASLTTSNPEELQKVLESTDLKPRLEKVLLLLKREVEVAKAQMEIRDHVENEIQSRQREMFLREQLKFIQQELGIAKDDKTAEIERLKARLEEVELPDHAAERIAEEFNKFSVLESGSPEYNVTRNYLDILTSLPWDQTTDDRLDLVEAAKILDRDHEGLADVKERILEFLGVGITRGEVSGSILLFVGPPGVGKTSLGRSIAKTLNREFFRFSLGGMRDEAEIKGHRRTYIGAMPGKFIQAIKETGSSNPVIMLDEIDKIGASFQGDPASALLEVLDPEQNSDFLDHYVDTRFDLSKVLFVCTANSLDTIPGPLLDRMEVIPLSGYLAEEKLAIAANHLWPKLIKDAGLDRRKITIDKAAIRKVIEGYAREAGVRRLEKLLGKIVRKAVMKLVRDGESRVRVRAADVNDYLGSPVYETDSRVQGVGVVNGLAWTANGGATLSIEATRAHEYSRGLKLTGQLGDVMKESAEIAYSYVLGNATELGVDASYFENAFVHLHVPAGATPKDGPSAGITMTSALVSLARGKKLKGDIAMTGEVTLTGQVLAVGGIQEKILAAKRAGIKTIILPEANRGAFDELSDAVRKGIKVHFAEHYSDVLKVLFG